MSLQINKKENILIKEKYINISTFTFLFILVILGLFWFSYFIYPSYFNTGDLTNAKPCSTRVYKAYALAIFCVLGLEYYRFVSNPYTKSKLHGDEKKIEQLLNKKIMRVFIIGLIASCFTYVAVVNYIRFLRAKGESYGGKRDKDKKDEFRVSLYGDNKYYIEKKMKGGTWSRYLTTTKYKYSAGSLGRFGSKNEDAILIEKSHMDYTLWNGKQRASDRAY